MSDIPTRPTIVTLCGSTKFKQQFIEANFRETMEGKIVLTVGWFSHSDGNIFYPSPEEKKRLDALHFRKIELSDEIFVVNVGGYIGESTKNEIAHAVSLRKIIRWLEPPLTARKTCPHGVDPLQTCLSCVREKGAA